MRSLARRHGINPKTVAKWIGWYTYSTLLKANGEDAKVVQKVIRHTNTSTIMNIDTRALTPAKEQAHSKAADVLFNRTPQQMVQ